jgi:hypothetical protein
VPHEDHPRLGLGQPDHAVPAMGDRPDLGLEPLPDP